MQALRMAVCAAVVVWAAALSLTDLRDRRLPNVLTLGGAAAVLAGATACGRALPALLGGLGLAGLYLVVHLVAPGGLGAGDVKLALALGGLTAALDAGVWALAALGAPVLTSCAGGASLIAGRGGAVPHGPAMCAASLAAAALVVL